MKKFMTLGLASVMALGALAATVGTAQAFPHPHPHYNNGGGWGGGGALIAGTILGLAVAGVAGSYGYGAPYGYPAPYAYGGGNAHAQWCFQHYPNSYNPNTNTFVGYNGVTYYCQSPYG